MSDKLYLECSAGISGDMLTAALLDLGADEDVLREALQSIPADGFTVEIKQVEKSGLRALDFAVILDEQHENHDHDMAYLHGAHVHGHHFAQEHPHHEHRGLPEIIRIIENTRMTPHAKELAKRIFDILAQAEAKAHGRKKEQVHFHEVGAVDSIVDIIAAAVCVDNLGVTEVIIPYLCEGGGSVRCQHGLLPVPVPAVTNIAAEYGIRLRRIDEDGEFVTPTGAAIAAALCTSKLLPQEYIIERIGLGAGKREYKHPGILRAMFIKEASNGDSICKLECNIDDCTAEAMGYAMECLLEAGAKDVHFIPVFMKKNRPAYLLNVICANEDMDKMEQIIFAQTTTIGIRRQFMQRSVLKRSIETVETELGSAQVKRYFVQGRQRVHPEYDSVAALCKKSGKSYEEVYRMIEQKAYRQRRDIQP